MRTGTENESKIEIEIETLLGGKNGRIRTRVRIRWAGMLGGIGGVGGTAPKEVVTTRRNPVRQTRRDLKLARKGWGRG